MPVVVTCPNPACGKVSRAAEEMLGKTVKCKQCGVPWVLRATVDAGQDDTGSKGSVSKFNSASATGSGGNKRAGMSIDLPAMFGRYRLTRLLGEGGMGAVFLADDTDLGRTVALKLPKFGPDDPPQRVERFLREGRAAAAFQHPNICTLYDIGRLEGQPYLTMAYVEGRSLSELIDADAPLPLDKAVDLTKKIASALFHAHTKGIVHRDLKPGNILLDKNDQPFVTDFGLAKRLDDTGGERITHSGAVIGTPTYMSPEQVRGEGDTMGPATDIYSLGVMFFEMLTGRVPYKGSIGVIMGQILHAPVPTVKDARPDLPAWVDAAIRQAMSKDADDRFPTMQAFADCLQSRAVSHKPLGLQIDPADVVEEPPAAADIRASGKVKTLPAKAKPASKDSGDKPTRDGAKATKGDKKRSGTTKKKVGTNWMPVYLGGGVGLVAVVGLVVALAISGKGGVKSTGPGGGPDTKPGETAAVSVETVLGSVLKARKWEAGAVQELRSSSNSLAKQAALKDAELGETNDKTERVGLGDLWWQASQQTDLSGKARAALAARAAYHYQFLIDQVRGSERDRVLHRAISFYGPPDQVGRTPKFQQTTIKPLKAEASDNAYRNLTSVRLPCVISVAGAVPRDSNGDCWVTLKNANDDETGVRVASSAYGKRATIDDFPGSKKHAPENSREFPHRQYRAHGETNAVTWVLYRTDAGTMCEVYLNDTYAGTKLLPLLPPEGSFALMLRGVSVESGERPVSTWEGVRVWEVNEEPIDGRIAKKMEGGQFPGAK